MYEGFHKLAAAACSAAVLLTAAAPAVHAEDADRQIKIMCLGDSITDGFWLSGGYRNTLCKKITENGLEAQIDLVGPNWGGSGYAPRHAGYSGFSIENIAQEDSISGARSGISEFTGSLMDTYQPDAVFLQIGTNDILSLYDLEHFGERIGKLTDCILEKLPADGMLYLATLPVMDANDPLYISEYFFTVESMDAAVESCNEQIRAVAEKRKSEGKPIQIAEINRLLTKEDLYDGVHPSEAGYEKMGEFWYEKLTGFLSGETGEQTDSPAETTAAETEPEPQLRMGDINGDGTVKIEDAVLLCKHLASEAPLSAEQAARADLDGNRILNAADLTLLKRSLTVK